MDEERIATTVAAAASVDEFRSRFRGTVMCSGDAGYEQARRVWNHNIDRRPFLIVRCSGVADVIEAVSLARANGMLVAVRGGGHNVAGHGTCAGGLVIDLGPMKGIRVDPTTCTARVQAGATWADLDRETQAFGLATTGGAVSNTGVAGLTLGGGEGWLTGKCGLTCDNLLSADVVTADGRFLTANATENADLFWGLRGGGGNFGIVTEFEFQVHPVGPLVMGGMVIHPFAQAREVLRFYRDFASALPDEADAWAGLLTSGDGTVVTAMLLAYNGPLDKADRILEPARKFGTPLADLVQPMPYVVRQRLLDDAFAAHGIHRYWKSGFAERLSDDLLDVVIEGAATFPSPMSSIVFVHVHGAAARVPSDKTAFALRRSQWDVNAVAQWLDPADSERHIAWTRTQWARIEPLTTGSAYINHLAGDDAPERTRASYGKNYDRLVVLKNKYDPMNLFRLNPNIPPTA